MSYETAPACELLATSCACCGRPLLDATSVETGVGPDCRKKYGYNDAQGAPDWLAAAQALDIIPDLLGPGAPAAIVAAWGIDARRASNLLVHRFARSEDLAEKGALMAAIYLLGYFRLATKLADNAAGKVEVLPVGDRLAVKTPYRADFVAALKAARVGARWDRDTKVWTVPTDQRARAALWAVLRNHFAGAMLVSEKGYSTIPVAA